MRRALRLVALLAFAALASVALAQPYPSKPIKFIVPFPAGGDLDPIARGLGDHFQATWGQPYILENKPGANAMIGTEYVAKSAPDGYTLLICSPGAMTINPNLYPNVPYTVGKDITPVSLVATAPMVLVIGKKMPAKNYSEFVSYIKANPGKVSFASAGRSRMLTMPPSWPCPLITLLPRGRRDAWRRRRYCASSLRNAPRDCT